MRQVKTMQDVQIVLNELLDWKTRQETKARDCHGLQIKGLGEAVDSDDAVTLQQVKDLIQQSKGGA